MHGGRRGGVAELVGDEQPPVPVVVRVRQRVDLGDERRGVDVAVLLHAQVELQVGPVRRQRVDDLLELVGERHDSERGVWQIPTIRSLPPAGRASTGCSRLLEQLEGEEEAEVTRAALAAGVPEAMVLEELQREVERRLMRTRQFYDEWR